jgi:alkaline phosphatase
MDFFLESGASSDPSLEDMTRSAISMLQKEANGFVLLVEGI